MTEHGEASTSALRTRVRLPPSPHIHPHDRVHADIFFDSKGNTMKRNGIINVLRLWLLQIFGDDKQYFEIVPRNYFHALQMNSFRIELREECEDAHAGNDAYGYIILPFDEQYEVLDNQTLLLIIKDWLSDYSNEIQFMRIGACVRGEYISDSGEVFNERSISLIMDKAMPEIMISIAKRLKLNIGCTMIIIKVENSLKIWGI